MIILSNASVIDAEQAKRLKELKVSQVEISLYAMDEGIHGSVTGIKGSHAKTIQGIYSLRDGLGNKYHNDKNFLNIRRWQILLKYLDCVYLQVQ